MTNKKVLVAYFSATGTTEGLAKRLARITEGDLFKIIPEEPYTADDLNWQNSKSRSSVEMQDKKCRPAISSKFAVVYLQYRPKLTDRNIFVNRP